MMHELVAIERPTSLKSSDVPQGSVHSWFFSFHLLTNDMWHYISSHLMGYVDDTSLFGPVPVSQSRFRMATHLS